MTDKALKLALARELPELITVYNTVNSAGLCWADSDSPVAEHEWDWVATECEKNLTPTQQAAHLKNLSEHGNLCWQNRATSYLKITGKLPA